MRSIFFAVAMMASGASVAAEPNFGYYATGPAFLGPFVSPDLSDRAAYNYRTRLHDAAQNPPNFASVYQAVTWGCGTSCETGAVINQETGKVTFFPFTICCSSKDADPGFKRIQFRRDSALIVFSGLLNEHGKDAEHHYVFDGREFRYIGAYPYEVSPTEIPYFDVDAQCLATHGGNNFARSECIETEQLNYDITKMIFTQLDEPDKKKCADAAAAARHYRYTNLYHCVSNARQMLEIRRKQSNPPPRFRY